MVFESKPEILTLSQLESPVFQLALPCLYKLQSLQHNPELLIPPGIDKLVSLLGRVRAVSFTILLGNLLRDDDYVPSLSVLCSTQNINQSPISNLDSDADKADKTLENYRQIAVQEGTLIPADQIIFGLIANECLMDGAEVESFIVSTPFRGCNIGSAFYAVFESWLRVLGFKYYWGNNSQENLGFFLKTGRYLLDCLKDQYRSGPHRLIPIKRILPGYPTIKFIDPELERECVKPECLKDL